MTSLHVLGLALLQEVGFDIVTMWGSMGYLAKLALVLIVLIAVGVVVALFFRVVGSK
jgi:flagellar biosynthesis/type III secretory pathway M-ring protein FliF/YscJ